MPQASTFTGPELITELDGRMRNLSEIPHDQLRLAFRGRTIGWAHDFKSTTALITRETSFGMIGTVDGLDIIVYIIDDDLVSMQQFGAEMPSCCNLNLGLFNPELEICWPMTTAQLVAFLDLKIEVDDEVEAMLGMMRLSLDSLAEH